MPPEAAEAKWVGMVMSERTKATRHKQAVAAQRKTRRLSLKQMDADGKDEEAFSRLQGRWGPGESCIVFIFLLHYHRRPAKPKPADARIHKVDGGRRPPSDGSRNIHACIHYEGHPAETPAMKGNVVECE